MQTFNILQSKSKIYSNLLHLLNQKYIFFEVGK